MQTFIAMNNQIRMLCGGFTSSTSTVKLCVSFDKTFHINSNFTLIPKCTSVSKLKLYAAYSHFSAEEISNFS